MWKPVERVTFEVVGNRLGQDFDPVVTIKDARGRRVVERDNDVGLMFDCRFAHTFEKTGTYTIEVRDTRFRGSDHLVYVLRVGRFPEGRVAFPSTIRAGDSVSVLSIPGDDRLHAARSRSRAIRRPRASSRSYGGPATRLRPGFPFRSRPIRTPWSRSPTTHPRRPRSPRSRSVLHGAIATPGDRDAFAFDLDAGQRLDGTRRVPPAGIARRSRRDADRSGRQDRQSRRYAPGRRDELRDPGEVERPASLAGAEPDRRRRA